MSNVSFSQVKEIYDDFSLKEKEFLTAFKKGYENFTCDLFHEAMRDIDVMGNTKTYLDLDIRLYRI